MQEIVNLSLKIFTLRYLISSKCSKTTWNSPEQPVELPQKITNELTTKHSVYCYAITTVGPYCAVIIEGLWYCETSQLEVA